MYLALVDCDRVRQHFELPTRRHSEGEMDTKGAEAGNIRNALRDWKAWLGIALTGIALFRLFSALTHVGLSRVVQIIVETYRAIFHWPFNLVFEWLGINLSVFQKDMILLWTIAGAAVSRSLFLYVQSIGNKPRREQYFGSPVMAGRRSKLQRWFESWPPFDEFLSYPVINYVLVSSSLVWWPLIVPFLFMQPYVCSHSITIYQEENRPRQNLPIKKILISRRSKSPKSEEKNYGSTKYEYTYLYDIRIVAAIQLIAAMAVFVLISTLNSFDL